MPEKNVDLHGSAPDKHKFALLLIDVINDFDYSRGRSAAETCAPSGANSFTLETPGAKSGRPGNLCKRQFWTMEIRLPAHCRLLCTTWPRRRYRQVTAARRRRLLRAQTKTFRFFFPRLLRLFSDTWKPKL